MKNQVKDGIVDVVEQFDYSTQSESYNKEFVKWRRNKDNPYAYNFETNENESVFIDGEGFVRKSGIRTEADVCSKLIYLMGASAIVWIIIENVLDKLFVQLLDIIGFNIHVTFFNSAVYGGKTEVALVVVLTTMLKLIMPLLIVNRALKMPNSLKYPGRLNEPAELFGAISATMIVCVITGLPAAFSYETKEIYSFFRSYNADMSVWGQEEFLIYTFFDIIIVSVLFELLFHGAIFSALRQFGDYYAILITSVIAGALTQDYKMMVATALIASVSAIGRLRSGTIFTAIAVRITYKLYIFALNLIETSSSENMFLNRNFYMLSVFVVGVTLFTIVFFSKKRREKKSFALYNWYLPLKKRLLLPLKIVPYVSAIALSILVAVMNVIL